MTFFEQSRYYFDYILPDILISNIIQINEFLSQFWWVFLIVVLMLFLISIRTFRKNIKLEFVFQEFDKFLQELSLKKEIKETEIFLLKSSKLLKATYCALYELRGETYILLESNTTDNKRVATPLRIGKKDLKRFKKSGNFLIKYFISQSEKNLILYFTRNDFDMRIYSGHISIMLGYYEEVSSYFKAKGGKALLDISKDTSISLMKLQMDKYQFFKFIIALIIKVTKAQNAKLLTKDDKLIFEYAPKSNTKLQKVFYIRNSPYKLEYYNQKPINAEQTTQVGSFLDMAGSFLVNIDKSSEMVQNYLELLNFTNEAIELENKYYKNHSLIVQTISVEVAKSLFLSEHEIDTISLGARLHDIGTIGDLLAILNKDKLGNKDMDLIKEHPLIGSIMVEPISHIYPISDIIKYHHERFDGKGYPFGLRESQIPIGAQIVAFGEFYAGITSDRSYKKGVTHEKAVEKMIELKGKMFNPTVVDAFLDIEKALKIKIDKIKAKEV